MVQKLWRPTRRKANEDALDAIMERIKEVATAGQVSELRSIQADLHGLIAGVQDLIGQLGAKKAYGQKANVDAVMAQIRKRIGTERPGRGQPTIIQDITARVSQGPRR